MAGKNAMECFGEIELTLPNGRQVRGKVPTLKQQLEVMALCEDIACGKRGAQMKLVMQFPKLVNLEEELNQLTFEEFFDVVNRFFGRRGSGNGKTEQTETSPKSDLSESSPSTPDTTGDPPTLICTGPSS